MVYENAIILEVALIAGKIKLLYGVINIGVTRACTNINITPPDERILDT